MAWAIGLRDDYSSADLRVWRGIAGMQIKCVVC